MAEFSNRDEVKRWLDAIEPAERRREIAVALAARAALRFARFGQPRRSDAAKFIHDRCRAKPAARPLRSATIMETKRQRRAERSRFASATAQRLDLDGEHGDGRRAKASQAEGAQAEEIVNTTRAANPQAPHLTSPRETRGESICVGSQAWIGVQGRSSLMRTLARTTSFRMIAVMATLAFLPALRRRL